MSSKGATCTTRYECMDCHTKDWKRPATTFSHNATEPFEQWSHGICDDCDKLREEWHKAYDHRPTRIDSIGDIILHRELGKVTVVEIDSFTSLIVETWDHVRYRLHQPVDPSLWVWKLV